MDTTERTEACLHAAGNILVAPAELHGHDAIRDFFGETVTPEDLASGPPELARRTVYLCGDISGISGGQLRAAARVRVIRELSHGYDGSVGEPWTPVGLGRVPLRVQGAGVYYRRFFDLDDDHFGRIRTEHSFQSLTESTKPGTAHRSGIYLTPVTRHGDALRFRLLRCSTNLSGPTEDFGPTDTRIVEALNEEAATLFRDQAALNHVLAQIYHNTPATDGRKQSKAKISAHADKTKDMPANGVMAFCTFYDGLDKLRPLAEDTFDYGVKGASGLTRLHFRLKEPAGSHQNHDGAVLPSQFTVTLHPGSVFFMPLSTNRLYTHEIRPSALDAGLVPTRLGYVVRCSNAEAVHRGGRTFLEAAGDLVELGPPTPAGMDELRRLYAEENRTSSYIDYGGPFDFSMNTGDYLAPGVQDLG
ncbi:hypothetical protein P8A21_13310 [Streptomyces poriferorum]|uniref:Fe2OG dioxygenase domain-containing protein n=1 Tax=Streptomyces poriferorum TaxID=2798799 RepID=A0ABY9IWQ5_9ACTN|nr:MULTISPECIES: hypothetical protein [unclassified Streptomyces]MDP5312042.1 hypothetical protein [Streptomyces sp. Alt4]WLQ48415.1 hypothetical protein P8A21_13310 [Streptomyces sp. Alt1]WLQ58901.1 hypothetical protein P8A19_27260 [Streptomyces sp. Alt2]